MHLDWRAYPNFSEAEFRCRGSGRCDMDPEFMEALQTLRTALGFPFIVSSGFRSPEYNNRVSSTGLDGPHTTGKAVDIRVYGERAYRLVAAAPQYGFSGIGVSQKGNHASRFIHLDRGLPDLRPWIWSY